MAISAPVTLTSGISSAAASYTTASVAPGANRLLLLTVHCYVASGSVQPTTPTVAGNGLTWVQIGTDVIVDASGTDRGTAFMFRAMGASPSSGTITITPSLTCKGTWILDEIDGTDTSGTNGSGAIVQSVKTEAASVTTISVVLASFGSSSNAGYGMVACQNVGAKTYNNSWTKKTEVTTNSITYASTGYFLGNSQLTMNVTWTTAGRTGAMAVEIKAAGGGSGTLNQAIETDTAQAFTGAKTGTLGQPTEADTAQPFTGAKVGTLGQPIETDVAFTLTGAKAGTLGQPIETGTAQPFSGLKAGALGQSAESDTAQPFSSSAGGSGTLQQVVETEVALPFIGVKVGMIGQPIQPSIAFAFTAVKAGQLLQVVEVDVALQLNPPPPAAPSPERTHIVTAEDRTHTVRAEDRIRVVRAESRMHVVPAEDRTKGA